MSLKSIVREQERIIRLASTIGSVSPYRVSSDVGYADRFAWAGPGTLSRKAIKVSMIIEKRQFKNFMKQAKQVKNVQL